MSECSCRIVRRNHMAWVNQRDIDMCRIERCDHCLGLEKRIEEAQRLEEAMRDQRIRDKERIAKLEARNAELEKLYESACQRFDRLDKQV